MDYTLSDLEDWDARICSIAKGHGLDWFDIEYEFIDYYSMIGAMAFHGLPSHFNHWSFGKSFERTHHMYNVGMEGLPYELIINSNPSIAYMMRENPLYLQVLIMAHCVGHSDFFKNNRMFKGTRPETIIGRCRAAKKRFQDYVENPTVGIEKVEEVIDACHAVQFQVQKPSAIRKTRQEIIDEHNEKMKRDPDLHELDTSKIVLEPDYDILRFISENANRLPNWKRDVIDVCQDEGKYFWPQLMTKIMNEGWASYWHYTILHELELPPELHVAFIKSHNQVIRPHIGGINPYHLGFHLFQRIKERMGLEECFIAREVHNDASFLRQYLTQEDCEELNLFSYSSKSHGTSVDDVSDEEGWEKVKDDLVKQVGGGAIPVLRVDDIRRDGVLVLGHEHDGRDLDIAETQATLQHVAKLWGNDVVLNTMLDGKYHKLTSDV